METNLTKNPSLLAWLDEKVELLKPSKIMWIDGSAEQIAALKKEAVGAHWYWLSIGFMPINQ